MKTIYKYLPVSAFALLLVVNFASALGAPNGPGYQNLPQGSPITLDSIDYIIWRIGVFLVGTSTVLGTIFIIWSGISYMYAGDDPDRVKTAIGRLKAAVIGMAIVLGVGVIIQTVFGVVTGAFFCNFSLGSICIF